MGVNKTFGRQEVVDITKTAATLEEAGIKSIALLRGSAQNDPPIVLVDAGHFYGLFGTIIKQSIKKNEIENGNFMEETYNRAFVKFNNKVEEECKKLMSAGFQKVIVFWDDSSKSPPAKQQERENRRMKRDAGILKIDSSLKKMLAKRSAINNNKTMALFTSNLAWQFGPPPVPLAHIREDSAAFNYANIGNGITHVLSRNEADLSIASAELVLRSAVVFAEDSDYVYLINGPIIRPPKEKRKEYEVLHGLRSAKEIVIGQVAGHDYSAHKGLSGWGFVKTLRLLSTIANVDDFVNAMDLFRAFIIAMQEAGLEFNVEEMQKVQNGVRIWQNRSHGEGIVTHRTFTLLSSDQVRARARQFTEQPLNFTVTMGPQKKRVLPPQQKSPETAQEELKRRKRVSKLPGRERTMQMIPFQPTDQMEEPFRVYQRRQAAAGDTQVLGDEDDDEVEETATELVSATHIAARRITTARPKDLAQIYSIKTVKSKAALAINRPVDPITGQYLFSQKREPALKLFRTLALCTKIFGRIYSQAVQLYFNEVLSDPSWRHLLRQLDGEEGLKTVLRGIATIFVKPLNRRQGNSIDAVNLNQLTSAQEIELRDRSSNIDSLMIRIRLGPLKDVKDIPYALLINDGTINKFISAIENKLKKQFYKLSRCYLRRQLPFLSDIDLKAVTSLYMTLDRDMVNLSIVQQSLPQLNVNQNAIIETLIKRRDGLLRHQLQDPRSRLTNPAICVSKNAIPLAHLSAILVRQNGLENYGTHVSIDFNPSFWHISGEEILKRMLSNAPMYMEDMVVFLNLHHHRLINRLAVSHTGTGICKSGYSNRRDYVPIQSEAQFQQWEEDWAVYDGQLRRNVCLLLDANFDNLADEVKERRKSDLFKKPTETPLAAIMESMFKTNHFSKNQVFYWGGMDTDGYSICFNTIDITRGIQSSRSQGRRDIIDIFHAEAVNTSLLYNMTRAQLLRLPSVQKVERHINNIGRLQFTISADHSQEKVTKNGLPGWIKEVQHAPHLAASITIGIDTGEVEEIAAVGHVQGQLKVLLFSAKSTTSTTSLRRSKRQRLRRKNRFDLEKTRSSFQHSPALHILHSTAEIEYEMSNSVRRYEYNRFAQKKRKLDQQLQQFLRVFNLQDRSVSAQIFIGSDNKRRPGTVKGNCNAFLRHLALYCKKFCPNVQFHLVREHFTSSLCPDRTCLNPMTQARNELTYPTRDGQGNVYRLLQCTHCLLHCDLHQVPARCHICWGQRCSTHLDTPFLTCIKCQQIHCQAHMEIEDTTNSCEDCQAIQQSSSQTCSRCINCMDCQNLASNRASNCDTCQILYQETLGECTVCRSFPIWHRDAVGALNIMANGLHRQRHNRWLFIA